MFDYVLKNGTVVDGTGQKSYIADIGIKNGKIEKIGKIDQAENVIECTGKIVSPGFIDNHNHSDMRFLNGYDGYNYLEQGVTTEITGNCGDAPAPDYGSIIDKYNLDNAEKIAYIKKTTETYGAFIEEAKKVPHGTNIAFYAGHNNIRGSVMGYSDAPPTKAQLESMKTLINEAMQLGYLGYSSGLVYPPSFYAETDELIELAKTVAPYGGIYATHIRNEGDRLVESVKEAIRIGEEGGCPVTISHLKVIALRNKGTSSIILELIEKANQRGVKVLADQYPYIASSAPLIAQLPPKYMTKGPKAFLERIADADFQKEVEKAIYAETNLFDSGIDTAGWNACMISRASNSPEAVGKTLSELALMWNCTPMFACCRVLRENNGMVQGIYFSQNNEDMLNIMRSPYVCCGTDWSDYPTHISPDKTSGAHPRGTASFLHRLEFIRDNNIMSMEMAIRSVTYLAALACGLENQIGKLEEGRSADICVLDWDNIRTYADYTHPFKQNEGLDCVFVNGCLSVEKGKANGTLSGKVLLKTIPR